MTRTELGLGALAAALLALPLAQFFFMLLFEGFEGSYALAYALSALLCAALWLLSQIQLQASRDPISVRAFLFISLGAASLVFALGGVFVPALRPVGSGVVTSAIIFALAASGTAFAMTLRYSFLRGRAIAIRTVRRLDSGG